jgi:hypothetical protein
MSRKKSLLGKPIESSVPHKAPHDDGGTLALIDWARRHPYGLGATAGTGLHSKIVFSNGEIEASGMADSVWDAV